MQEQSFRPMLLREFMRVLKIAKSERQAFRQLLDELVQSGEVIRIRGNRYGLPDKMNLVTGRFQGHPDGYGFLIPETPGEADVFIPKRARMDVMHRDLAVARIETEKPDGLREGRIVRVLERAAAEIVGRYEPGRGEFGFVVPTEARIGYDIYVAPADRGTARPGDLVVIEIVQYPTEARSPAGRIVRVLGAADDPKLDTEMVLAEFHLPHAFPPEVEAAAETLPQRVTLPAAGGGAKRRDLRALATVTIDGERARDFDDAVSIERRPDGGMRLWVHIADVGAYVPWDSTLDQEARTRGTSVYFPDHVVPMFPEKLSNGICSLNPREDRLTLTCEMLFDRHGERQAYEIYESVIHSRERMTYTAVKQILVDRDPQVCERYAPLLDDFAQMELLCNLLRAGRERLGSIDFDLPEPGIILDLQGKTTDIIREERYISHRIVEEFMLQANRAVAEHMTALDVPCLYRVHESPDPVRITDLTEFIQAFGLQMGPRGKRAPGEIEPHHLQALVQQVRGKPEERLINHIVLRSMKQARYGVENRGHFGLAFSHYTHFTSPIRRYPDLVVHRVVKEWLANGGFSPARKDALAELLPPIAKSSSERERVAMEAEREVVDLKKIRFMANKVGEEFFGFITGVTAFGLFVELEDIFVEGLVHISTLGDDYYVFQEKQHCLLGRNSKRRFRIADRVRVRVERIDMARRRLELGLAEAVIPTERKRRRSRH